jgi:hypothetical protein
LRRLSGVGALAVLLFSAFALTDAPIPAHAASNPGNLTLASVTYPTSGCAIGPALTFCDQAPGTQGQWATFFVSAKAAVTGVAVSVAAIPGLAGNYATGDFAVTTTPPPLVSANGVPCTGNLAANQPCTFFVAFSPTAAGLRQAQITVTDSAGDSLAVNVEGTGTQFALAPPLAQNCTPAVLSDNAYMYCAQSISPASPTTETFTLTSAAGAANVNVALAAIPGLESEFQPADFTIETPPCPSTIPAGGNCSIGVAFTPTAAGLRSAALVATDSSGDRTTIYLAGPAASGLSVTQVLPGDTQPCGMTNPFVFCNLPVGGISPTTTLSLTNTSGTQVTGLSVPKNSVIAQGATAPDFTVQSSSCSSVLPANASCNITVALTPTTTGLRQGAIVVTDAQGDVATVNLAGTGDDYNIATQLPTEQSVIPGNSVTFTATLTPDHVFGMNGEQVTFVCPSALPANTSCAATPCPAAITPGTPVTVKVTFVTSSAIVVAPPPTSACSSYRPSTGELIGAPPASQPPSSGARGVPSRSSPLYAAAFVFSGLGAVGLLIFGLSVLPIVGRRKRAALIVLCAGLAAAVLTGCHHGKPAITTATTTGAANLTLFGTALDASGNSLNASRQFQVTLDVVAK